MWLLVSRHQVTIIIIGEGDLEGGGRPGPPSGSTTAYIHT